MEIFESEIEFKISVRPEMSIYSDLHLVFISEDPNFTPEKDLLLLCIEKASNFCPENEVHATLSNNIEFHTAVDGFESIRCNFCGAEISIEFWSQQMDKSFENNFKDLNFDAGCCKNVHNLNDLHYNVPQGFSKFSITVISPKLSDNDLAELSVLLEKQLQTKLRSFYLHF